MTQNGAGPDHSSTEAISNRAGESSSMASASPPRSRWWRYLLVGTGISLVMMATLAYFLPQLLKPALNRWTPDALAWLADIDGDIHIRHWDWKRLDIDSARLTLDDGTEIRLGKLALQFAPEQWLNTVHRSWIQSLTLDTLDVTLQQSGERVAVLTAQQAGSAAKRRLESSVLKVPDLLGLLQLPVDRVVIRTINIQHQLAVAHLSAELTPEHWHLGGDVELTDVGHPWQLELQLHQRGDWILQLADGEQLLMQSFAAISQADRNTRIEFRQQWQADQLQQRFSALRDVPDLLTDVTLNGVLELKPILKIPDDVVLQAELIAHTRPGQLMPDWRWQSGTLRVELDKPDPGSQWSLTLATQELKMDLRTDPVRRVKQLSGDLIAQCAPAFELCELSGRLPLLISGSESLNLVLNPSLLLKHPAAPELLQASGDISLDIKARIPLPEDQGSGNMTLHTQGKLALEAGLNSGTVTSKGLPLIAKIPTIQGWKIGALRGIWGRGLSLNWEQRRTGFGLNANPVMLDLQPVQLNKEDIQLNISQSELSCVPGLRLMECDLELGLLPSRAGEWPLPDVRIQAHTGLNLTDMALDMQIKLTAARQQLKLRGFLQHELASGTGALQWHLQQARLNWNNMGLAELIELTSVQLLGGQVSGQGWIDWSLNDGMIKPDIMLRGDDISLIYNDSIAADHWSLMLSMQPSLTPLANDQDSGVEWVVDAQLAGESLNVGVELTDMLARSRLRILPDWYELNLYEIHMNLLGGQIQVPAARYDSRKEYNAFGVELYRIQLKELAALEPNAGVKATGILDGVLPVVLTKDGPTVPGGNLFARPPGGVLRYNTATSASLKQTDPTVGLAMQALENFHYTELGSGIQYQADGALNLALRFQGANPDFFDGQSTHLNVNLDYNLLDLLESLRVANDVISRLEDKYQ